MLRQRRRWLPGRQLVVVVDSTDAVVEVLTCAAPSDPAPVRNSLTMVSPKDQEPVSRPGDGLAAYPRGVGWRDDTHS